MTPDANTIVCPKCKAKIPLSDAVAAPLLDAARREFDVERQKITVDAWEKAKKDAEGEVGNVLSAARRERQVAIDRADRLNKEIQEKDAKLAESQAEQARLLAKERELDDARRELDLTVARRVNESAAAIQLKATLDAEAAATLKVSEKQVLIDSLTGKIEELNRRAEQGDNRVAGEAQELVLESMLRAKFPMDTITPVAKGVFGGDCLQTVVSPSGVVVGSILWESKRTKAWDDKWLGKLRNDQRASRAYVAVLVTQTMPRDVTTFDLIGDVWVVKFELAVAIAVMVRRSMLEIATVEQNAVGQATKAELLYKYLTGPMFRSRMQAAVEKFGEMAEDLRKERAAMTRGWAKRDMQIQVAVESIAGCVGDVTGIAGKVILEIEGLQLTGGETDGK